jgi:hypothetical protein
MAWKQISECLPAWLTAEIGKGAGTGEGAGQVVVREVVPTSSGEQAAPVNLGNAKGRPVHHKAPPQRRTGRPLTLVVIEGRGGGRRQEEGTSAAYARAGGGNPASNSLKLVVG